MRARVYLSGPMTNGGTASTQAQEDNLAAALKAFVDLANAGYAPLAPQLTFQVEKRYPKAILYNEWLDIDFPWVEVADAVLRIGGESVGADEECAHAEAHGIPVCRSLPELTMKIPPMKLDLRGEKTSGESRKTQQSETVLEEAARIVTGERRRDYDHPKPNHDRIGRIWGVQLEKYMQDHKPGDPVPARTVALMMIGLKLAREAFTPKRDSIVDIAGYAQCIDYIEQAERA